MTIAAGGCAPAFKYVTKAVPAHIESVVIAGLDRAIHLFRKKMDARVKSAHDAERVGSIGAESAARFCPRG
jgi:hypothetical protein